MNARHTDVPRSISTTCNVMPSEKNVTAGREVDRRETRRCRRWRGGGHPLSLTSYDVIIEARSELATSSPIDPSAHVDTPDPTKA